MTLPQIPKTLIDDLINDRCVVFVGAGLSQDAGLPGWSKLLNRMIDWAEENNINVNDKSELRSLIQGTSCCLWPEN